MSAFAFGGIPEKAVKKAFQSAELYVSSELLKEYREVPLTLRIEGKIDHNQLKALISGMASFVTKVKIVRPVKKLSVCRDTKDNMILECCLSGGVDFLITGDKDLLEILDLPFKLKILTPSEFVKKD